MKIAVLQMNSGIDPEANASILLAAIADAARGGAVMLFAPEMSGQLDRNRERARAHMSSEAHSMLVTEVCLAAQKSGIWVHIGSLPFVGERTDGRLVNRSLVINEHGLIKARYDKIHLFDVDLETGETWRESATYGAGEQVVAVQTPIGLLGLTICYDIRFSSLFTSLSNSGATVIAAPSAFTVPTGEAHWHTLLRARAIESSVFVIAAAQCGGHEDGRQTYGHSLVVDPWGTIILDMEKKLALGFVDIDLDQIAAVRGRIPALSNRRTISSVADLY